MRLTAKWRFGLRHHGVDGEGLTSRARAALAGSLISSQDDNVDKDAEIAWEGKIRKRLAELDAGAVETIPWSEVRKRILGL